MLSKEVFIVLRHYLKEGVSKTAIARKLGVSRMTVYRHAVSAEAEPAYGPRPPRPTLLDGYKAYIRGRLEAYPELSAARLLAEITERGYRGRYTRVKDYVRQVRPRKPVEIERRFDVSPGEQAQRLQDRSNASPAGGPVGNREQPEGSVKDIQGDTG